MKIDGSGSWKSTCDKGPRTYFSFSLLQLAECEINIFIAHKGYNMAIEYAEVIIIFLKDILKHATLVRFGEK